MRLLVILLPFPAECTHYLIGIPGTAIRLPVVRGLTSGAAPPQ